MASEEDSLRRSSVLGERFSHDHVFWNHRLGSRWDCGRRFPAIRHGDSDQNVFRFRLGVLD